MNPFLKNNKFKSILLVPLIIDNENVDFIIDSMNNSVNEIVGIEMDAFTNYEFAAILKIIENANFRHDEDRRYKIYLSPKDEAEGGGVIKQLALIYKAMRKNFIMDKIDIYYDSSDEDIDTNQQTEIDKRNAQLKKLCKELGLIQAVPQFIKDYPDAKEEFIQYLEKYLLKGHLMNYLRPDNKKKSKYLFGTF